MDRFGGGEQRVFALTRLPPAHHLKGRALVLDTRGHGGNYFHWLVEAAPRLAWVEAVAGSLSQVDHYILAQTDSRYVRDTLERLGLDDRKRVDSRRFPHLQADELIVFFRHPGVCSSRNSQTVTGVVPAQAKSCRSLAKGDLREPWAEKQSGRRSMKRRRLPTSSPRVCLSLKWTVYPYPNRRSSFILPILSSLTTEPHWQILCFVKRGTRVLEIFPPLYQKTDLLGCCRGLGFVVSRRYRLAGRE